MTWLFCLSVRPHPSRSTALRLRLPHASLRPHRPQVSFGGSLVCTKLAQMERGPRYIMQRSVHKAQGQHVWPA